MIYQLQEPVDTVIAQLRAQAAAALKQGRRLAAKLGGEPLLLTHVPGGCGDRPDCYLMRIGTERRSPMRTFPTAEGAASAFVQALPASVVVAVLEKLNQ